VDTYRRPQTAILQSLASYRKTVFSGRLRSCVSRANFKMQYKDVLGEALRTEQGN